MFHTPAGSTIESLTEDVAVLGAAEAVLRLMGAYDICGLVAQARRDLNVRLGRLWAEKSEETGRQLCLAPPGAYEEPSPF